MPKFHFINEKYAYESIQLELHDTKVNKFMIWGMAKLSVSTNYLSSIKLEKVKPLRTEQGIAVEFQLK
ncbi:hypothetical protein [Clostridium thailandense]|uniref:hypothetical protein n=1 Tax=Clostridium thailandense TaxID=2794346 RepID=UPI00398A0F59